MKLGVGSYTSWRSKITKVKEIMLGLLAFSDFLFLGDQDMIIVRMLQIMIFFISLIFKILDDTVLQGWDRDLLLQSKHSTEPI